MTAATKKLDQKKKEVQPQPTTAPAPKQEAAKPPAPVISRQRQTINKLRDAWKERGVDMSKLTETIDGKFINVVVGEGWPLVAVGPTGGLELPTIRSYAKAFDAAVIADQLLAKQTTRDLKKQATAKAPTAPAAAPSEMKEASSSKETVTARKQKQDAAVEKQLEARA